MRKWIFVLLSLISSECLAVGKSLVCDQLKARVSSQSPENKEKTYQYLLSLLKLSNNEFKRQMNQFDKLIKLYDLEKNESASQDDLYSVHQCLFDIFASFKKHIGQTLAAYFNSELLTANNSQIEPLLVRLIENECRDQSQCSQALKEEVIRLHDVGKSNKYLWRLGLTGKSGVLALFEIFDQLDEQKCGEPGSYEFRLAEIVILSFPAYSEKKPIKDFVIQEINRRIEKRTYSNIKTNYLLEKYFPPEYKKIFLSQGVTNMRISPSEAFISESSTFTITVEIGSDRNSLRKDSIVLYNADATGKLLTVVGKMYDDGQHGDKQANDGTYTTQMVVKESKPLKRYYRVRAAYSGIRNPYLSETKFLEFFPHLPDAVVNQAFSAIKLIQNHFDANVASMGLAKAQNKALAEALAHPHIGPGNANQSGNSLSIYYVYIDPKTKFKIKIPGIISLVDPSLRSDRL